MSTAVAAGVSPAAHGGFRRSGSGGKPDPEETDRMRNANGFFSVPDDEEEEEELQEQHELGQTAAARSEEEEDEEEEEEDTGALSEASSIGAASSDGSSIGENSASDKEEEDEDEEEVQSKAQGLGMMGLATLESLEDALPSKRGLSNFYAGKSKSFTSLAEAAATAAAKEIAKPENPFNKRRRVLQAWSRRRASCSALATTYLPPLLAPDHAVVEEDDEEGADDEDEDGEGSSGGGRGLRSRRPPTFPSPRLSVHATNAAGQMARNSSFRSPRSFSMTDLHSADYDYE